MRTYAMLILTSEQLIQFCEFKKKLWTRNITSDKGYYFIIIKSSFHWEGFTTQMSMHLITKLQTHEIKWIDVKEEIEIFIIIFGDFNGSFKNWHIKKTGN